MIFKRRDALPPLVEMAVDEARDLGFDGGISYDGDARSLQVEGLGTVPLGPFIDRSVGLTEAQQRPKMRAAITKAARANPVELPARYDTVEPAMRDLVRQRLTDLRTNPGSAPVLQEIARIDRAAGLEGWEMPMLEAAAAYTDMANERPVDTAHLAAANCYRLAGRVDEARSHAEAAIPLIHTAWSSDTFNPSIGRLCAAQLIAGRRAELPGTAATFGQPQTGPRWWPICLAAGAAEAGDRDSLTREVEAAERLADAEPMTWRGNEPADRDLAEILRGWLNDLA